jgi:hypothetical protein
MLSISKPLSASQARTYHAREFASQEQNHWSRDQQGHSEWQGKLAQQWAWRHSRVRAFRPAERGPASAHLGAAHAPSGLFLPIPRKSKICLLPHCEVTI